MPRVEWTEVALERLAAIWTRANDRAAVTAAVNRIDATLQRDPEAQGESRDEGRRILIESPLGVLFQVSPTDRVVLVLAIWRIDSRQRS